MAAALFICGGLLAVAACSTVRDDAHGDEAVSSGERIIDPYGELRVTLLPDPEDHSKPDDPSLENGDYDIRVFPGGDDTSGAKCDFQWDAIVHEAGHGSIGETVVFDVLEGWYCANASADIVLSNYRCGPCGGSCSGSGEAVFIAEGGTAESSVFIACDFVFCDTNEDCDTAPETAGTGKISGGCRGCASGRGDLPIKSVPLIMALGLCMAGRRRSPTIRPQRPTSSTPRPA